MRDLTTLITEGQQVPEVRAPGADPYWAGLRDSDPPIFLLQAAPTYQGGILPDGVWQRVPIGGAGQVLTAQADGSVAWNNNPGGFANPMTTVGDTMFEAAGPVPARLAIGATGQVLTVVGGLPAWAAPQTGFSNPMTAIGDLITGTTGGNATRLAIGAANQVLTVIGGVPTWQNSAAGFANPMTTAGDLLFENATPAPARLAIGTAGQVLTVSGGLPVWSNSSAGLTNPMTTLGDIITGAGGGTPQRLGAGANGQVLLISAGVPIWGNSPSGFANPMTTAGDLIVGGTGGSGTRLGIGTNGQQLQVVNGAVAWAPQLGIPKGGPSASQQVIWQQPDGSMLVLPLSTYGIVNGDDGLWINTAYGLLPTYTDPDMGTVQTIGTVQLEAATYNIISGIVKPPQCNLVGQGPGTFLSCKTTGAVISSHYGAVGGTNQNLTKAGRIAHLQVNGGAASANAGATGISVGDGNQHTIEDVWIGDFNAAGCTGLLVTNTHFFTEKAAVKRVFIWNCETLCQMITAVSDVSHEYNDYELYLRAYGKGNGINILDNNVATPGNDQRGVVVSGVHFNGSLRVRGNYITPISSLAPAGAPVPAMISLYSSGGTAGSMNGTIDFHMECNGGGLAPYKIYLNDTSVVVGNNGAQGLLRFDGGTDQAAPTIGQFAFQGNINDCQTFRRVQAPTPPASGSGYQNIQDDAWVYLSTSGGTITAVTVDSVALPIVAGATQGPFLVKWNRFITPTYTGTLSWTWANAS